MPNLESAECTEARSVVKEFYSYHFGNDMKLTAENLKAREKFLTPDFIKSLQGKESANDPFTTNNTDYPKAFSIGKCEVVEASKTNLRVLLFWKTDTRTEQREIKVEAVKQGDKWLVGRILN